MINQIDKKYKEYFDQVFMLEISEYCWNIYQALLNINKLLKRGGIFWLSTHFIYPVHNPIECDSIRLTPYGVQKLLEETGFKIEEMKPRKMVGGKIKEGMIEEKMRPARDYDGHDWVGCIVKCRKI